MHSQEAREEGVVAAAQCTWCEQVWIITHQHSQEARQERVAAAMCHDDHHQLDERVDGPRYHRQYSRDLQYMGGGRVLGFRIKRMIRLPSALSSHASSMSAQRHFGPLLPSSPPSFPSRLLLLLVAQRQSPRPSLPPPPPHTHLLCPPLLLLVAQRMVDAQLKHEAKEAVRRVVELEEAGGTQTQQVGGEGL